MKKINIKGPIIGNDDQLIYDWLELEATSPQTVASQLPDSGEDIEVMINSGGGDAYAGSEIYTTLREYTGNVTVKIVGIAASAASVIAMAGDTIQISPTAQMMIHNVSSWTYGDHVEHDKMRGVLSGHDKSIANSYVARTEKTLDEILGLMAEETWFSAEDAVENGFADEVMFQDQQEAPQLVASMAPALPQNVVNKLRAVKTKEDDERIDPEVKGLVNELVEKKVKELLNYIEIEEDKENKQDDEPENKFKGFVF